MTACSTAWCALVAATLAAWAQPEASPQFRPSAFAQPAGWPQVYGAARSQETLGPGVIYERWQLATASGPLELSIATIDLRNPFVSLLVATHRDVILGPGEALSAIADRARAELGINADYFDINGSGSPLGVVVVGNRLLHQPNAATAFVVGDRNEVSMGPVALRATVEKAPSAALAVGAVNDWSRSAPIAILTSSLGGNEGFGASEAVLAWTGAPGRYRVRGLATNVATLLPLGADDLALAANGKEEQQWLSALGEGDEVTVAFETQPRLDSIRWAVGGGPLLLRNGVLVDDPNAPAPEEKNVFYPLTGAGLSADGATLWLVVVDGRAPGRSIGLTRPQLAWLFAALGASTAMAFDSGGSSEMVVRHLGDPTESVANIPSDGRERHIADALLVVNNAPTGPATTILLRPEAPAVLAGSRFEVKARAIDDHQQPVAVDPSVVQYAVDPSERASVDGAGQFTARTAGPARVAAIAGAVRGEAHVKIVDSIARLAITGYGRNVPVGSAAHFGITALTDGGESIAVAPDAVVWSASGATGRMEKDGTFVAGTAPGRVLVTAEAGRARATLPVLVGEHEMLLAAVPAAGEGAGLWRWIASPKELPGGIDAEPAPDGTPALRLAYDFSTASGTRAAYAQTDFPVGGEPLAMAIEVFGDGRGEWLRGAYRNADGIVDSVNIARRVDWYGWRKFRIALPAQVRFPITWMRLYAVETSKTAREQGSLWFRNFSAIYPGP